MQLWKQAEKDFEDAFDQYGKGVFVHRLSDTAQAKATAGKKAFVVAQPSDYLVTLNGVTFFAEVKSTTDPTTFHFANIRKQQLAKSRQIVMAGGTYLFFIKSEELNQWFCVPAAIIHAVDRTKKSMSWLELEPYKHAL